MIAAKYFYLKYTGVVYLMQRIGHGYDVHRFNKKRPLVIGGVLIKFKKGLKGHSDADVLIHAIMDALLGAAGLYDIGKHFPDTDVAYKDISSLKLLGYVGVLLHDNNFAIQNIDSTIIAEAPKLAPYICEMKKNITQVLNISQNSVNIKATTEEGLGFTGKGKGIAAHAVCLVVRN